jgi:hypothetical protein
MVLFQELQKIISYPKRDNIYYQQRKLSTFLMHYQKFAFYAYCGVAGSASKMASQ